MASQRILIIDDDPDLREVLTEALRGEGYAVTALESAFGAAGLARRLRPGVILLDIGLPYRSGASLLTELKANPSTAGIPVVVISANPDALTAGRRAQATAVLDKPFQVEALLGAVRAACSS